MELGEDGIAGDHDDLLEVLEEMASYPPDGLKENYATVVKDARDPVHEHWAEIEAVALAENDGHLGGEELMRLIEWSYRQPHNAPRNR